VPIQSEPCSAANVVVGSLPLEPAGTVMSGAPQKKCRTHPPRRADDTIVTLPPSAMTRMHETLGRESQVQTRRRVLSSREQPSVANRNFGEMTSDMNEPSGGDCPDLLVDGRTLRADLRDHVADVRDTGLEARDSAATVRDRISDHRDYLAEQSEASGRSGMTSDAIAQASRARLNARSDRRRASQDRHASASSRALAQGDRQAAAADRRVASHMLDLSAPHVAIEPFGAHNPPRSADGHATA
jgi:hypothetical protein